MLRSARDSGSEYGFECTGIDRRWRVGPRIIAERMLAVGLLGYAEEPRRSRIETDEDRLR